MLTDAQQSKRDELERKLEALKAKRSEMEEPRYYTEWKACWGSWPVFIDTVNSALSGSATAAAICRRREACSSALASTAAGVSGAQDLVTDTPVADGAAWHAAGLGQLMGAPWITGACRLWI